jgi:hypothetical protein
MNIKLNKPLICKLSGSAQNRRLIGRFSSTINIGHLSGSANLKMSTFSKKYSGLIVWSFESPNAPYYHRWQQP